MKAKFEITISHKPDEADNAISARDELIQQHPGMIIRLIESEQYPSGKGWFNLTQEEQK